MRKKSLFDQRGYLPWFASRLFGGGFLRIYRKMLSILRPTLWLRRIFRLLMWLVWLLESGALLLLLALVSLLLLVPSLVLLLVLLPSALLVRARAATVLMPRLQGRRAVLLAQECDSLSARLSADGYFTVLVFSRGFLRRQYTVRQDGEGALLSPWLYFSLRRRISSSASRVICIDFFENDLAGRVLDML